MTMIFFAAGSWPPDATAIRAPCRSHS